MSLLHDAYDLLQQGKPHAASTLLHSIIEDNPEDSQALYLIGIIAMQNNDEEKAAEWFTKTVNISPEATPAHYNLGVLCQNRGDLHAALHHYQTANKLDPEDTDIRFNLALTSKQLGLLAEAKTHFETIRQHTPNDPETLYNLANTEQQLGNNRQAISLLETLLEQVPDHLSALNNLGYLYHKEGLVDKAIPVYQKLIGHGHNSTAAKHLLAALTGTTTSQAPTAYIKDVFDQFADHFDESLQQKLGYNTPTLLRQLLNANLPSATFKHGLDLGCGTGLSGETFTDCTSKLTGIDLSPKMLKQAQEKKIYHNLHESDLVPFILQAQASFDLYIAADVFVYIGDLSPLFKAIAESTTTATFTFSTEQSNDDYSLKPTGRYGHSVAYVNSLAKKYGFAILAHKSAPIRKEGEEWLAGELYILKSGG